ncbi:MAG: peptidylprolyl isomerase [Polyangiaceae bacterium]|jgi:FKBP-type peptidyl-prolyl cis-trans isomerase SlyD
MDSIQTNAFVVLEYILRDAEGEIVDRSDEGEGEPIRYVHGYGMLVPGLEARLVGMKQGESREIAVPAAEAFGEYDEELVLEVDRGELPDPKAVVVGDELVAESPDGEEASMHVVEVHDDHVVVDANHPLAGVDLSYAITVVELRAATAEEIEDAARELEDSEDAHHVHGPDCGHDADLVQLGKKLTN